MVDLSFEVLSLRNWRANCTTWLYRLMFAEAGVTHSVQGQTFLVHGHHILGTRASSSGCAGITARVRGHHRPGARASPPWYAGTIARACGHHRPDARAVAPGCRAAAPAYRGTISPIPGHHLPCSEGAAPRQGIACPRARDRVPACTGSRARVHGIACPRARDRVPAGTGSRARVHGTTRRVHGITRPCARGHPRASKDARRHGRVARPFGGEVAHSEGHDHPVEPGRRARSPIRRPMRQQRGLHELASTARSPQTRSGTARASARVARFPYGKVRSRRRNARMRQRDPPRHGGTRGALRSGLGTP